MSQGKKIIHERSNHPENKGAAEVFNETLGDYLSDCY